MDSRLHTRAKGLLTANGNAIQVNVAEAQNVSRVARSSQPITKGSTLRWELSRDGTNLKASLLLATRAGHRLPQGHHRRGVKKRVTTELLPLQRTLFRAVKIYATVFLSHSLLYLYPQSFRFRLFFSVCVLRFLLCECRKDIPNEDSEILTIKKERNIRIVMSDD